MKKLMVIVCVFVVQMAVEGYAAHVYIYDASGSAQKYNRYFLPATMCTINGAKAIPINVGEFTRIYVDGKKRKYDVVCKVARALDVKKEIRFRNNNVYLELRITRYKGGVLKQVKKLPKDFYKDYKEAK